jgi:predicted protein tyrosine phosphatase
MSAVASYCLSNNGKHHSTLYVQSQPTLQEHKQLTLIHCVATLSRPFIAAFNAALSLAWMSSTGAAALNTGKVVANARRETALEMVDAWLEHRGTKRIADCMMRDG